ncbi:MAG TPA: methyl-accepting chemotaxis protein, partial [Gemmatimonadaceae bacterium]|nr:methyl-accepting chemotaxis protein [Gemmatimonadaceae bacterium]
MTASPLPLIPRSAAGFLKPMFSALQRRALRASILFGTVFIGGLVAILWQIYHLLPADVRNRALGVDGVTTAIIIAALWIALAVATTAFAGVIFVREHVSGPAAELARMHEAVAKGDLSSVYNPSVANSAVDRLSRSTGTMVNELRNMATRMRTSATDNDKLASQIAQTSQTVAASARDGAETSKAISRDAVAREGAISQLSHDADRMVEITAQLREASEHGFKRDKALRQRAQETLKRLDHTSQSLESLVANAHMSAEAVDALATATDEIKAFLVLVQKISR